VKEFYEKYVNNYKPEERKDEVDKFPGLKEELLDQIARKKYEQQRRKDMDKSFALEQNYLAKQKLDEDSLRRLEQDRRTKEGLLNDNKYLIEEKKRNKENDMLTSRQNELDSLKRLNDTIVREEEDKRMRRDDHLNKVRGDLQEQMDEKKRLKAQRLALDKLPPEEYRNPHLYACQHGSGLYPCAVCNRKYPIKMLTKRSVSQRIIRRKQFKV